MISVIIPIYNVEDYLEKCLNSVLQQTYTDWEAWLVDDGSNDRSGIICDDFSLKDSRFKVVHQENKGLSEARNTGLRKATGDYISFIDGDDYIDTHFLEILWSTLEKYNSDIVITQLNSIAYRGGETLLDPTSYTI